MRRRRKKRIARTRPNGAEREVPIETVATIAKPDIVEIHTLNDAHGYEEPIADPEEIADEDPARGFERASEAANAPPKTDAPPEPKPRFSPESLIALLERVYVGATLNHARRKGIPITPEIEALGKLSELERNLLEITAPAALANLDKAEAFLQRYGHLLFAGTVFLGTLSRYRVVSSIAKEKHKEREERTAEADPSHGFHAVP